MASAGKTLQFTNDSKKTEKRGNIKKMTLTAMLAAIAVILNVYGDTGTVYAGIYKT